MCLPRSFLQIIGSVARAVLERVEFAEEAHLGGDLRGGEAVGGRREGDHRLDDVAHPRLVEIDTPDAGLADLRREGELLEHVISDEALIDAAQSVSKSLQYRFESADHFGKLVQCAAAFEFPRVMDHRFDAQDAFAFAVDLEGQPAAVQLEDGQIIAGSLDRDLPFGRALGAPAIFRTKRWFITRGNSNAAARSTSFPKWSAGSKRYCKDLLTL